MIGCRPTRARAPPAPTLDRAARYGPIALDAMDMIANQPTAMASPPEPNAKSASGRPMLPEFAKSGC